MPVVLRINMHKQKRGRKGFKFSAEIKESHVEA